MINFAAKNEYEDVVKLLESGGYTYGSGPHGQVGFVKIYSKPGYYMWITFSLLQKTVWLYEEYDCGGMLQNPFFSIPQEVLKDVNCFSDWWDETISHYLDSYV